MTDPAWNDDFTDMLRALLDAGVEFMVVGAHAMAVHGVPRATGDLDLWVRPSDENAHRVIVALTAFGAPLASHGIGEGDFAIPDTVYQIGLPPSRIDLLTSISGVDFEHAWNGRVHGEIFGMAIPFIGLDAQIANKRASERDKDLVDVRLLERKQKGS